MSSPQSDAKCHPRESGDQQDSRFRGNDSLVITLGIETSCDETSVAVVRNNKILSNVVYSSLDEHRKFGGVVPEIASRSHLEAILPCLREATRKARVELDKIDLIAVTRGPGLMGALLVGLAAAKSLSASLSKPLIGVDHVIAHMYAGFLSSKSACFPCLGLVVSGGHTLLIRMESPSRVTILGRTLDDAAGEAFDKVAKILGLGYPGGPEVDHLSRGQDATRFFFTRPYLSGDSLDFSFSGLKTAVLYRVQEIESRKKLKAMDVKALCAGFQETVCDVLIEKTRRALQKTRLKTVIVGGGVSANKRLREKFVSAAKREKFKVIFPENALCQDNAAMIAGLGEALYKERGADTLELSGYPDFADVFPKNSDGNKTRRI